MYKHVFIIFTGISFKLKNQFFRRTRLYADEEFDENRNTFEVFMSLYISRSFGNVHLNVSNLVDFTYCIHFIKLIIP